MIALGTSKNRCERADYRADEAQRPRHNNELAEEAKTKFWRRLTFVQRKSSPPPGGRVETSTAQGSNLDAQLFYRVALLNSLLSLSLTSGAAEELKMGVPGAELARQKCMLCHDAKNIVRLRLTRGGWEDTVDLMIERGAPINKQERTVIIDYLTENYGVK